MSDSTRAVANAFYEAMTSNDFDKASTFLADDCIEHNPPPIPDFKPGPEGFKAMVAMWGVGFTDLTIKIEKVAVEGDWFFAHGTWSGKHTGSMMGETATGNDVTGNFIEMSRVADGKLVEHRSYGDDMKVFAALGIAPPPAG
jgi:predicted ester cyclase